MKKCCLMIPISSHLSNLPNQQINKVIEPHLLKYVRNNKQIKYFKFIFRAYRIPHLEFVSHTGFEYNEIAKPFKYLYYLEQYVSTAYLATYLDFLVVTQSMSSQ